MSEASIIRIRPHYYIHVLDKMSNVTRVELGPMTFTREEQEQVVLNPTSMVMIPPRHYAIIENPVLRDGDDIVQDKLGQVKIRHGDREVRREGEPFALYPGESLYGKVSPLQVVAPNTALRLVAKRDVTVDEVAHVAGDEWIFQGPGTYVPRVEVDVAEIIKANIVRPLEAIKLRCVKSFKDGSGNVRQAGEEYIYRTAGAYLPNVDEVFVETVRATILTEKKALHLRARQEFQDVFGIDRKAGEEWLVTLGDTESHIPDVHEIVVGEVPVTILSSRQYCVIVDPVDDKTGKPRLGYRSLIKGERSFFLRPGERLENGIQKVHVLDSEEALLLRAREEFQDEETTRRPGDRWMIHGPCDYVPPVTVEILESRRVIPLDVNEGIYVRDVKTGRVRAVIGQSYLLKSDEELSSKDLPSAVQDLLAKEGKPVDPNGQTKVVTYKAPHNTAVQIYDYKAKQPRVIFGPDLVMLGPDEQFTVLSLSGDKPKRPHVIKSLSLQLGPDFMTDIVIVETADHARLSLKLSYNWHFEVDADDKDKIFSVPDFVGDACKAIASRVRGEVALHSFDEFHRNSAKLIRTAVFGVDENEKIRNRFHFSANSLVISNIDIQSVEPVDSRTRDALQKSVQLAIEITTRSQEAEARHEAERREQEARGQLEKFKLQNEARAEESRKNLLQLQSASATVESTGAATAEAKAQAARAQIKGQAAVDAARLLAEANAIKSRSGMTQLMAEQEAETLHQRALNELEVSRARDLAAIESGKFKRIVDAIGKDTLKSITTSGPETQEKLLGGLGLKSFMVNDPNSPINMFNK